MFSFRAARSRAPGGAQHRTRLAALSPRAFTAAVRTSQEAHDVSATEPNRLMVFGETVAICCEHTDTLRGQNAQLLHVI
jgi:hypothetical protein